MANGDVEDSKSEADTNTVRSWDVFKSAPASEEVIPFEERRWYRFIIKTLKICTYILTFCLVLGAGVISKLGLLVMTSRLNSNTSVANCEDSSLGPPIPTEERIYWTWLLYFAFAVPEFFTFFRSVRFCIFKGQTLPSWLEFGFPFIFETLHTVGLALLTFSVLPLVDSLKGAIFCSTVAFIPAILAVFTGYHGTGWGVFRILDILSILFQGTIVFMWVLFPESSEKNIWLLPISVILISFGFWHNYLDKDSEFGFIRFLAKFKPDLLENGYFTYALISIWKMILFLAVMILSVEIQGVQNVENMFDMFTDAFQFNISSNTLYTGYEQNELNIWLSPLFLQILGSLLCYIVGKYTCKICIQRLSFSVPLTLVTPVTMILLGTVNLCFFNNPFFGSMKFVTPKGNYFSEHHAWIWIFWFISHFWITIHIWLPNSDRLARTEKMFSVPMYSGLLIDQSLTLNRRRDKKLKLDNMRKLGSDGKTVYMNPSERNDIPRIYACATMWHETKEEMLEIMKSILRMDQDQGIRRIAAEQLQIVNGYYEYETHIFFDDAFQLSDPEDYNSPQILNSFVKIFIQVIDLAPEHIYNGNMTIRPPLKFPTPYGGRLEWTLPGKTKMILHLKDKSKIRHKKRWSQCMYMYYLLGYKFMDLKISDQERDIRARNTFLLALDGDVDFQPIAVERLIDLMKKNPKLGAACGRIHPTGGAGLMLWYQKFEYAIGHWLQKATEHVLGCVLCSPGCFSLFRGRALMSDNVMATYTTISTEPRHYVQYDQGEDRWLCTLILQEGYRVDYSAASDAFTHAPEEFDEFYNQRRRWVPSTTANIMDLLTSFRRTVSKNPDISYWYIAYQFLLMFGTLMGPGTIFLMLVGAMNAVFGLNKWLSFILNLIPLAVFSFVCYYGKSKTQLALAKILSVAYALLMVAVVVGIMVLIAEEGLLSPSALFLVLIAASFIISAILHPLEFDCLIYGLVYFITIPSMYLLLIIFSVFNLNNVSWGTREGPKIKTKQELLEEEKEMEEQKHKQEKRGIFHFLREGKDDTEGSFEFSFAGLFKLMCCTKEKKDSSQIASSLEHMAYRLESLDRKLEMLTTGTSPRLDSSPSSVSTSPNRRLVSSLRSSKRASELGMESLPEENEEIKFLRHIQFADLEPLQTEVVRDDIKEPYWISDSILMRRKISRLTEEETTFWNELIQTYLFPIDANKKKEADMANALMHLRNQCVFTFFMLNSIFVLLIFMLEMQKRSVNIKWPFGDRELTLEPIGFIFVAFFAVILIIQFIAMLFHRFGTFSHILASTPLDIRIGGPCVPKTVQAKREDATVNKGGIGFVHALLQDDSIDDEETKEKKKIQAEDNFVANLHRRTTLSMHATDSLDERFEKNWNKITHLNPAVQDKVLSKAMPIEESQKRETLNVLRSRLSMRQSSLVSQTSSGSYESGSESSDAKSGSLDEESLRKQIPIIQVGGINNDGFQSEHDC